MTSQEDGSVLRVPDDQIDYTDDLVYLYRGERFTGVGFDDVPEFGLSEVSYLNGLQDGPARDWYPSGQLRSEAIFLMNIRHGHSREFRENGSLASEETYEHGVHTRSVEFDPQGREIVTFELSEESPNYRILQRLRGQFGQNT